MEGRVYGDGRVGCVMMEGRGMVMEGECGDGG